MRLPQVRLDLGRNLEFLNGLRGVALEQGSPQISVALGVVWRVVDCLSKLGKGFIPFAKLSEYQTKAIVGFIEVGGFSKAFIEFGNDLIRPGTVSAKKFPDDKMRLGDVRLIADSTPGFVDGLIEVRLAKGFPWIEVECLLE